MRYGLLVHLTIFLFVDNNEHRREHWRTNEVSFSKDDLEKGTNNLGKSTDNLLKGIHEPRKETNYLGKETDDLGKEIDDLIKVTSKLGKGTNKLGDSITDKPSRSCHAHPANRTIQFAT